MMLKIFQISFHGLILCHCNKLIRLEHLYIFSEHVKSVLELKDGMVHVMVKALNVMFAPITAK